MAAEYYSIDFYSDYALENAITYSGFSNGSIGYAIVYDGNQGQTQYRVEGDSVVLSIPELYLGCNVGSLYEPSEISIDVSESGFFYAFELTVGDSTHELSGGEGGFTGTIGYLSRSAVVLTGFYSDGDYDELPSVSMDVVFSLSTSAAGLKAVCADTGCTIDFFERGEAVTVVDDPNSEGYMVEPVVVGGHEAYAIVDPDGGSFISNNGANNAQVTLRVTDTFCIHVHIDSNNNSGWSVDIEVTIDGTEYTLYPGLSGGKGHYDYYIGAVADGEGYVLEAYASLTEVGPYGIATDDTLHIGASTRGNTSASLEIIMF